MSRQKAVSLLLQLSIAFFLLYSILGAALHPDDWIGYFPSLFHSHISSTVFLQIWGVGELILAVWIISGIRIFLPSLITTAILLFFVLINPSAFDTLFRNISIAAGSFALCIMHFPRSHVINRRTR